MFTNSSAAILGRLLEPDSGGLSSDAARSILGLRFPRTDHERMTELSAKASAGTLTTTEGAELDEYLRVADLLALMQSKARKSLN
ncbi:MAG: hypothetical protein JNM56_35530 [Planctomycetia bacterium]|nr:hypothetical protein [Planctomycetia bacterium]